ncbi:hypothetical protein [Brachybacterium sacelli]
MVPDLAGKLKAVVQIERDCPTRSDSADSLTEDDHRSSDAAEANL